MSRVCPTCAFKAAPGDRFCRGCYTVFEFAPRNEARPVPKRRSSRWPAAVTLFLIGGTYWIGQLDSSPWAHEEGSIEAVAAGLKRGAIGMFTSVGGSISPRAGAVPAAQGEPGWPGSEAGGERKEGGEARAAPVSRWRAEVADADPCSADRKCEAVLRFGPGKIALVEVREEANGELRIRPLDAPSEELLNRNKDALIVRTGRNRTPVEIPVTRAD